MLETGIISKENSKKLKRIGYNFESSNYPNGICIKLKNPSNNLILEVIEDHNADKLRIMYPEGFLYAEEVVDINLFDSEHEEYAIILSYKIDNMEMMQVIERVEYEKE